MGLMFTVATLDIVAESDLTMKAEDIVYDFHLNKVRPIDDYESPSKTRDGDFDPATV